MQVRFWGTRGSIATPGPGTVRYGGNTSCVEVRTSAGTVIVLDCGTGARHLGERLLAEAGDDRAAGHLLIGHTHWDHIQGLPFFGPLFQSGGRWEVYGPMGLGSSMAGTLAGQMNYQYFPVALDQLAADIGYHDLVEGTFEVGDALVTAIYLNHPALTLGFRVEADGVAVVYATDHEPHDRNLATGGDPKASPADGRHVEFVEGADLLVHDAQYLAGDFPAKVGWGHSTVEYAVDVARAAGVKRLSLFHHDPSRTDEQIDRLAAAAEARMGSAGLVSAAAEGTSVELEPRPTGRRSTPALDGALRRADSVPPRRDVVLAVRDRLLTGALAEAVRAGHLSVAADGMADGRPSVVVVDVDDVECRDQLEEVLGDGGAHPWKSFVLAVTRFPPSGSGWAVDDWLVWPCSQAMLGAKLYAAVLGRACRWRTAPLPPHEQARIAALAALEVLDTEVAPQLQDLVELARRQLGVAVAAINLIDTDRQWTAAAAGIDARGLDTPRDHSVCTHAVGGPDVLEVPDLLFDDRFADNPALAAAGPVRFYAGAPLVLPGGHCVGTLCVLDPRPRRLATSEIGELRRIAELVRDELVAGSH